MYGAPLGIPEALSGDNSYGLRGYPSPSPQTLIVVGYQHQYIEPYFATCTLAGKITNRYNIENEESKVPDIFVCRNMHGTWEEFWKQIQHFG